MGSGFGLAAAGGPSDGGYKLEFTTEALVPLVKLAEFCIRQADISFKFQSVNLLSQQVDRFGPEFCNYDYPYLASLWHRSLGRRVPAKQCRLLSEV